MQKKTFFSALETFNFSNACAIQINLGTKYLLKKTVPEKMGYWQNESEFGKRYAASKHHLGSLGLRLKKRKVFKIVKWPLDFLKIHSVFFL